MWPVKTNHALAENIIFGIFCSNTEISNYGMGRNLDRFSH